MEQLLQSLKGKTLDDKSIADLIKALESDNSAARKASEVIHHHAAGSSADIHSVDDLVIASQAAEMEFASIKRYFSSQTSTSAGGIDGLADEDLSSDSEDEVIINHKKEVSVLDAILSKNSMKTVDDDGKDEVCSDVDTTVEPVADLSSVPSTVVVPFGAKKISLGKVQSVVDGLLVIAEFGISDTPTEAERIAHAQVVSACDIESLVFLEGSEPLSVIGMIVDILGTVKNPMHLVLVTNKAMVDELSSNLIGARMCTFDSHSRMVEVDEIGGTTVIRGVPQICDDDGDDDNVSNDDLPIEDAPPAYYPPTHGRQAYAPEQHIVNPRPAYGHAQHQYGRHHQQPNQTHFARPQHAQQHHMDGQYQHAAVFANYRSAQPVVSTQQPNHYYGRQPPPPPQ